MRSDTLLLSDLTRRLEAEPRVWLRLAVQRPQDDWQLSLLEVILVERPPDWTPGRWAYERAVFLATAVSGSTVARWLERGRISIRGISSRIVVQDQVHAERRQSDFGGIFAPLTWPTTEWTVHLNAEPRQMLHDELVADGAPAFLTFDLAASAFFGVPASPNRSFAGRECVVREQDIQARIDSVRIRASQVIVAVSGSRLTGTRLTLGGAPGRTKNLRKDTREVRFPLVDGIGYGAWIALHRDTRLLDRRGLDPVWGAPQVEVEVDPTTELEIIIGRGEGIATEFKRQLPSQRESMARVMKTVAAFANGGGGALVLGVDDDGSVTGLEVTDPRATVDSMTQLLRDWVRPHVDADVGLAEIQGKQVMLIRVRSGNEPPYGVATTERRTEYYVRRGGTTAPATPADVRAAVRLRLERERNHRTPLR